MKIGDRVQVTHDELDYANLCGKVTDIDADFLDDDSGLVAIGVRLDDGRSFWLSPEWLRDVTPYAQGDGLPLFR